MYYRSTMDKCICCKKKIINADDKRELRSKALETLKKASISRQSKIHKHRHFSTGIIHNSCYLRFTNLKLSWQPEDVKIEPGDSIIEESMISQSLSEKLPAEEQNVREDNMSKSIEKIIKLK